MAAWTSPTTWATNDIPSATDLNAELRDNPLALKKSAQMVSHRKITSVGIGTSNTVICTGSYDFESGVEYILEFSIPYITQSSAAVTTYESYITANGTQVGKGILASGAYTSGQCGGVLCRGLVTTAAGLNGTYTIEALMKGSSAIGTMVAASTLPALLTCRPKDVA